jgi:hypothetical protein
MTGDFSTDDLLEQARERLRELEETAVDELGDRIELQPGQHFLGKWRTDEVSMRTKDGETFTVYGLWDVEGKPRFHYRNAALVVEIEANRPSVGDAIVIVRGEDREFEVDGEKRTVHRYAVRCRSSSIPLPALSATESDQTAGGGGRQDDIPFL